jgi:hypothetical protein
LVRGNTPKDLMGAQVHLGKIHLRIPGLVGFANTAPTGFLFFFLNYIRILPSNYLMIVFSHGWPPILSLAARNWWSDFKRQWKRVVTLLGMAKVCRVYMFFWWRWDVPSSEVT